ncbi:hypothetical protein [Lysinibacillus piscis]|uniref:Uncharacterized protein n=1 Tax=Lysinibacillus piscis TaxID=2518931 RepID=A0ABQ5NPL6_9BACI|nr:hypothetical protein [Lysinibacillus sp. KH24]GLC90170.1 hypothetical protein LYSBPC_32970 [Lysinibacillus sp. KH24]
MATWTFSLMITNTTDRELVVDHPQLDWGIWNTEDVEERGPLNVPPHTTIQALGIKASTGPNGYECSCSWKDKVPAGEKSYGAISLSLDVPQKSKNRATCLVNHQLHVDGWEDLPEKGHNFVRSIIVSKIDS